MMEFGAFFVPVVLTLVVMCVACAFLFCYYTYKEVKAYNLRRKEIAKSKAPKIWSPK